VRFREGKSVLHLTIVSKHAYLSKGSRALRTIVKRFEIECPVSAVTFFHDRRFDGCDLEQIAGPVQARR
jgi:hypothetical protein